jgi:hypothetical protein
MTYNYYIISEFPQKLGVMSIEWILSFYALSAVPAALPGKTLVRFEKHCHPGKADSVLVMATLAALLG